MHPVRLLSVSLLTVVAGAQEWLALEGGHAMRGNVVFDRGRERAVLFGPAGDVWEFAGSRALHRAMDSGAQPGARQKPGMVYDEARGHVLLFGGQGLVNALADTWTWNGLRWSQPFSLLFPQRRVGCAITFDTARQRVLLHGGMDANTALTDTWEHDGNQWTERLPATVPAPLGDPCLCFDRARSVAVLVGSSPAGTHMMFYEWNGTDWTLRTPSLPVPPVRSGYALAYDEGRGRSVLTGGANNSGEVWEWNGTSWSLAGSSPAFGRASPAMWFDPLLNEVVVSGGIDTMAAQSDVWSWNGATATRRALPRTPRHAGYAPVWAWSPADGRPMLHSGNAANQAVTDSWTWDGSVWQSRTFTQAPMPRWLAAAAADPLQSRLFVFGGMDGAQVFSDLWSFNGTTWTSWTGAPMPAARSGAGLAFDSSRGELVMFGGQDRLGALLGDTWTWNGAWFARSVTAGPSVRQAHAMAFDASRSRTVLWGGVGPSSWETDTWEWNGNQWLPVVVATVPLVRGPGSMVYDHVRARILIIGSHAAAGPGAPCCHHGLWQYDGVDWTQIDLRNTSRIPQLVYDERRDRLVVFDGMVREWSSQVQSVTSYGTGCGAPLMLAPRTRARIGSPDFGLEVTSAPAGGAVLFGLGFAQANQPIGSGCTLLIGGQASTALQIASTTGIAVQPIALPQSPALRGLVVFAQSGALAPSSSALSLSRGLQITVGD